MLSKNKDSESFMNQTLHQNIFTSHTMSFSDATALPFREMNTDLKSSTFLLFNQASKIALVSVIDVYHCS